MVCATPAGLATYMFLGADNTLAAATGSPIPADTVGSVAEPKDEAEWTVYDDLAETFFVMVNNTADQALAARSSLLASF
ncbi:MAG: hypothetical protein ACI91G_001427 [Gammaproteobacteria bacterium]